MKDQFVSLHNHSTYSFQDGIGLPSQYFDKAEKNGQSALGVTDHGNVNAHFKWYREGKKRNIKAILGCEMYVVDNYEDKSSRERNHITVLALNNKGYKNLLQLVTKSWLEGFYYKPLTDWQTLSEYKEGLLFTSGCISSRFGEIMKSEMDVKNRMFDELKRQKELLGENYYIEVCPLAFDLGKQYTELMHNLAKVTQTPMLATMDCHYPEQHQNKIQEVLLCVQSNDKMNNPNRWKFDQDDFYLKTRAEMEQSFKNSYPNLDFTEALDNTVKVSEMVDFTFPTATPISYPMPENEKIDYFKKLCQKGLKEKGLGKRKEYLERTRYEFDIIVKKNFVDYFLVISDLVNWAKDNGILVGPARGSAAGSLVCYLTRITEVDPLKHDLIFERFIDINREDLPDIDIDFEDERRDDIKRYLESKYGIDKVGTLGTLSTFKGKQCISDISRVFEIPYSVEAKVKSLILERSGGDSRASFTVMDTLNEFESARQAVKDYPVLNFATELEGQIRQMSSHAAGVVISNEPLTNFCAIYQREGERVISMDYDDAISSGLLKIDILGLNTLTFVHKAAKLIKERHNKDIDFYNMELDDKKVYESFRDGSKLFGVFQFDGQAMNQICRQVKPHNFSELTDINALSRPGPLNSGGTTSYITRKEKRVKVEYPHKLMESLTKDTYGVVIYQEQVMKTMREIGKMSWKDTAEIRKLISRSQGVEKFNTFKAKFEVGAKENGLSQEEIDIIWDSICTFGSWAFNKSHSVSYTLISYWTMWLKVYYPLEYYVSILSTIHQEDKIKKIVKEYYREGNKLLPIDINKSKVTFSIDEKNIRIGFIQIKGIGFKVAKALIENQPYSNYSDFVEKIKGKRVSSKVKSLIDKLGGFQSIGGMVKNQMSLFDALGLSEKNWIPPTIEEVAQICPVAVELQLEKDWKDFLEKYMIKYPTKIENLTKEEPQIITDTSNFTYKEIIKNKIILDSKPEQYIMGIVYDKNLRNKLEVSLSKGKEMHIPEIVPFQKELKEIEMSGSINFNKPETQERIKWLNEQIKYHTDFCNFMIEDDSDFITARVGVKTFPKYRKFIFEELGEGEPIYVKGIMGSGIRMFFCNYIVSLPRLKKKIEDGIPFTEDERLLMKPILMRTKI